jgi:hypothetical protein
MVVIRGSHLFSTGLELVADAVLVVDLRAADLDAMHRCGDAWYWHRSDQVSFIFHRRLPRRVCPTADMPPQAGWKRDDGNHGVAGGAPPDMAVKRYHAIVA